MYVKVIKHTSVCEMLENHKGPCLHHNLKSTVELHDRAELKHVANLRKASGVKHCVPELRITKERLKRSANVGIC